MGYSAFRTALAPPWLRQAFGAAWDAAHGELEDAQVALAKEAVKARHPSHAPADALAKVGADRVLERGPEEAEADFRARLLLAFEAWSWAGTDKGLRTYALAPAGLATTLVIRNRDWDPAPPDLDTAKWARIWVAILAPHPWSDDGVWSDAGDLDDGGTWGSDATPEDVSRVRRLIRTWIPAHVTTVGIYLQLDTGDEGAAILLADAINARADLAVTAVADGDHVDLTAKVAGSAGDALTLEAYGAGVSVSGATLSGSTEATYANLEIVISGGSGLLEVSTWAGTWSVTWATSDAATAAALVAVLLASGTFTADWSIDYVPASNAYFIVRNVVGTAGNGGDVTLTGTGITFNGAGDPAFRTTSNGADATPATGTVTFTNAYGDVGCVVDGEQVNVPASIEWDGE